MQVGRLPGAGETWDGTKSWRRKAQASRMGAEAEIGAGWEGQRDWPQQQTGGAGKAGKLDVSCLCFPSCKE